MGKKQTKKKTRGGGFKKKKVFQTGFVLGDFGGALGIAGGGGNWTPQPPPPQPLVGY